MDILDEVRRQVQLLPQGPYTSGLKSVVGHIEVAYQHFERGRNQKDLTAFTDAIYRANQAFEGSVKEAYRVLAGKDPKKSRPYDIEQYLQSKQIFRERVLYLFTNYRREWRNPSTHDYDLDFDQNEAFLAIVSVSAFAKLAIDQIVEKIAFQATSEDLKTKGDAALSDVLPSVQTLHSSLVSSIQSFIREYIDGSRSMSYESEQQLMGSLGAYLSFTEEGSVVHSEYIIEGLERRTFVDFLVRNANEEVMIEITRSSRPRREQLSQLAKYLAYFPHASGILVVFSFNSPLRYQIEEEIVDNRSVSIISPAN